MRDSWLAFPARVGAELAAEPGVDATKLVIVLEALVRRQLAELPDVQRKGDTGRANGRRA
jgi:hypothetical protein